VGVSWFEGWWTSSLVVGSKTHPIGPFHFWDASRGDLGVQSIWKDRFSLSTPRIKYDSGLTVFDLTEIHLHNVILDSGDSSSRH
jgi:hypothetical protein